MASKEGNSGHLRVGIITNYEIPKSASAERVNKILFDSYNNDGYWRIIGQYYKKCDQYLMFGCFCSMAGDFIHNLGLVLLPLRRMFLFQQENHTYIPPRDWKPQLQEIFLEGDKFFYVDERSYQSRNDAYLVANAIVTSAEVAKDPNTILGGHSKPLINPDDIPSEFKQNLEMAIQVASDAVLAGHLPEAKSQDGEIETFIRDSISSQ